MTRRLDMKAFHRLQARLDDEMQGLARDAERRKALDEAIELRFEAIRSLTQRMHALFAPEVPSSTIPPAGPEGVVPDPLDALLPEGSPVPSPGTRRRPGRGSAIEKVADGTDVGTGNPESAGPVVIHGVTIDGRYEARANDIVRQARDNARAGIGRDAMDRYVGRFGWMRNLYLKAYDADVGDAVAAGIGNTPTEAGEVCAAKTTDEVLRMLAELDYKAPPPEVAEEAVAAETSRPASTGRVRRRSRELRWLKRYGEVAPGLYAKLSVLGRPTASKELKRMLGWSRKDIQKTLDALLRDGHIVEVETGVWALPA